MLLIWNARLPGHHGDLTLLNKFGGPDGEAFPFLSTAPLTLSYLAWVAMGGGLAATSFVRKDL